jgi:hypothetical protein
VTELTNTLYTRLRQAQALIREHGWVQHWAGDEQHGYCLTGALNRTGRDGLHIVLRSLVALQLEDDDVELYNDTQMNNRFEAIQALDFAPTTTRLYYAYGPHYEAVIGLIRQVAHLTERQDDELMRLCGDENLHDAQLRAVSAVKSNPLTAPYVDRVLEDVHHAARPLMACFAVIDQVAVTQLAFDLLMRGALSIRVNDVAPANAEFARIVGVTA